MYANLELSLSEGNGGIGILYRRLGCFAHLDGEVVDGGGGRRGGHTGKDGRRRRGELAGSGRVKEERAAVACGRSREPGERKQKRRS